MAAFGFRFTPCCPVFLLLGATEAEDSRWGDNLLVAVSLFFFWNHIFLFRLLEKGSRREKKTSGWPYEGGAMFELYSFLLDSSKSSDLCLIVACYAREVNNLLMAMFILVPHWLLRSEPQE